MSNNFWQTLKQKEQLNIGKSTTLRVNHYINLWRSRCYYKDIPDQAIDSLEKINRVPSYRSIANAILHNDLRLKKLGFVDDENELVKTLREIKKNEAQSNNMELF